MSSKRTVGQGKLLPEWSHSSLDHVADPFSGLGPQLITGGARLLAGFLAPKAQPNDDPMVISAAGNAEAIGGSTIAAIDASVLSVTRGRVSFAAGDMTSASSEAAAEDETGYATAQSSFSVTGADFAITATRTASGQGASANGTWHSESSKTYFLAIDIDGIAPGGGPINLTASSTATIAKPLQVVPGNNRATFEVESRVYGDSTHNDVAIDAVTVEDQLSAVTVVVNAAGAEDSKPGQDPDVIRTGGWSSDRITVGSGDDWVFAGFGNDTLNLGAGDNTGFGGLGDDRLIASDGDDWAFGGAGRDLLQMGNGANIGVGGLGDDTIYAGVSNDAIDGGSGNDIIDAGAGNNIFRLGSPWSGTDDGKDRYAAGSGADWYVMQRGSGIDVAKGFTLAQGDRLVAHAGDWDSDAGLRDLNGTAVILLRAPGAPEDLQIGLTTGGVRSVLTLDDYFLLNPQHSSAPAFGAFGDDQSLPILRDLFVDGDSAAELPNRMADFAISDMLSILG